MYKMKTADIFASEIAGFLEAELIGRDFIVRGPSSWRRMIDNTFVRADESGLDEHGFQSHKDVLVLASRLPVVQTDSISFLVVKEPHIKFIDVLNEFFIEFDEVKIAPSATIDKSARLGQGVAVGENVVIGPDVTIGDGTRILNNVVITGRVQVGEKCLIKHNSTVGSTGYDFEVDVQGRQVHFPHVGKIIIGDHVWIGSNSSIESSAIHETVIEDMVKIDDLVQIGANSVIRAGAMITAGAIISRGVEIGKNCLIAPNASVRDSVKIGDHVTLGIGAVALKDLKSHGVYVGNPAVFLKERDN